MNDLSELYKETILKHNRTPFNYGKPDVFSHFSQGLNAICGDQINIYMCINGDKITNIFFDGESCAIAMASASMMCEFLLGKSTDEARFYFVEFSRLMDKKGNHNFIEELNGLNVFSSVKKFPSRIKSVTLCWHAMKAAIDGLEYATTE